MSDATFFEQPTEALPAARLVAPLQLLRPLASLAATAFAVGFWGYVGFEVLLRRFG